MTILITGATGLIGRALTQSLLDQGIHPHVVTRRPHRALEMFDSRVTAFEWHPRTEPLPADALDGVERIIHLMGEPLYGPLSGERRARVAASRRIGTERIIEALGGRSRMHVIAASSVSVYGYGDGPPLTETTAVAPPRDRLGLALIDCEEAAEPLRASGAVVTQVRLGPVIAPGTFPDRLKTLFDQRMAWRNAHPEAAIPAIDLIDAVGLLTWLALSRPMPGAIHAVAPEPLYSAELEKLLAQVSPRRGRTGLPRWVLRSQIGVLADFVHSRRRVVPRRALDAGFTFSRPDPLESVRAVLAQHIGQPAADGGPVVGAAAQRA
jgi:NAD dependent epimerase/dehydratase family enzyme